MSVLDIRIYTTCIIFATGLCICKHSHGHTYVRRQKKKTLCTYAVVLSNGSRLTFVRKRGRSTTERVCEPTPAERVAHDAEIPDRTSYRYDTSSESLFPPPSSIALILTPPSSRLPVHLPRSPLRFLVSPPSLVPSISPA